MKEKGVGSPTSNNRLTVLSFFFATTCSRPEMKRHMRYQRAAKKIPVVLSAEEVARILEAAPGSGLRLCREKEEGVPAYDQAQLCYASFGGRDGYPGHSGIARACQA